MSSRCFESHLSYWQPSAALSCPSYQADHHRQYVGRRDQGRGRVNPEGGQLHKSRSIHGWAERISRRCGECASCFGGRIIARSGGGSQRGDRRLAVLLRGTHRLIRRWR